MYKIKRVQIYLVLALAVLAHLTVLNYISVFGAMPDLVLTSIVFFGLFLGGTAGLEAGLVGGFLKDIFALDYFGINTFVFAVTGILSGVMKRRFFGESRMTQVLLVFFLTAFSMTMHFLIVSALSRYLNLGFGEYLLTSVIPTSVYTSIVSIPVFSKLVSIYHLREKEDYL